MAKKAYVRNSENTEWVELASATTDLTNYATKTYADNAASTAVTNLIDAAPSSLNTLNELAAALGDDANFATTLTNLIAEKITNVPGMVSQYAGSSAPTGWLICDGTAISRTTYSALYSAIGTAYGAGDNSTTFNLPNLKGRVPVGIDSSQTEFDTLAETGGSKAVTLTAAESGLPAHSHGVSDPGHSHITMPLYGNGGQTDHGTMYTSNMGNLDYTSSNATGISINNNTAANASQAHNNLQPYIVMNYIIKI